MKVVSCLYCGGKKLTEVTRRSDHTGILECQKCQVMMVDTISDNTAELYTKDYFEKSESTEYGYSNYMSSPTADLVGKYGFARLFSDEKKHVDLGAADGSLMEVFDQEGFDTFGLEISVDAVNVIQQKGLKAEASNLHKFPESIKNIGIFTAYDLLEHADKPGAVLKNVHQSLSDDGVFVFSTLSVDKNNPNDHWLNHSLEHYVYYNRQNLTNILKDVFGDGQFGFVERKINGIAEFWGFATKGNSDRGLDVLKKIELDQMPKDPEIAYHLSLFYNQVSEFERSEKIIAKFKNRWTVSRYAEAVFYNNYVQGWLEKALQLTDEIKMFIPSSRGVFWRGYAHAEKVLFDIYQEQQKEEIIRLRENVFNLNNELQSLRGSRVIGRVIKARDVTVGKVYPRVKSLPRKSIRGVKNMIGFFLPMETKIAIGKKKRQIKSRLRHIRTVEQFVANQPLARGELTLSVVIPYYNRADTIDETLQSLAMQTYRDFEVIVVDDGSTEEVSSKRAIELEADYRSVIDITVIQQKNAGVAVARNNGIKQSRGRYVMCLDSDDILDDTYIEKAVIVLETDPDCSLVTTYRTDFGVRNEEYRPPDYNPLTLIDDNMVTTAAVFRRSAWEKTTGYKSGIGYEDWEYWLSLAENGDWGRTLREPLFRYRVAMNSRFADDKMAHWGNIKSIKKLHSGYKARIRQLMREKLKVKTIVTSETAFRNVNSVDSYQQGKNPRILIAIPWMTFGGAETLIYNYCRGLKDKYDLSFVTGIDSKHEWEYKFREITSHIFHLPQLFTSQSLYLEFISHYIKVHEVEVLHIIHSGFVFDMLPEIKRRHPNLKIAVTMFNDRVDEYVTKSVQYKQYIDSFNTDSAVVAESFGDKFQGTLHPTIIPNGIDCTNEFNPKNFSRNTIRKELGINDDELALFFVGRLSEEKNPDKYIKAADEVTRKYNAKAFVIGDGPMREACDRLLKDLKNDKLVPLGYQKEVARYLAACDVFVLPSSIEGFPLSILEAMAMGNAVVASRVGAIPDVIKDGKNGFTIEPGSTESIVEAVGSLADQKLLSNIKERNRSEAESLYSNEKLSARYDELYKGLTK